MDKNETPCPCCSGNSYEDCCKRLHEGDLPENALQLMRSRYAAFVLNIPDYIIATTHPASAQYSRNKFSWKRSISQFSQNSTFQKLEILDFKERNKVATVTFTAHIMQGNRDATFTEKSHFEKLNKRWLYRGGTLAEGHAPNIVTTDQLRLLPIAYYGDPILRRKADPITSITDDIKELVDEMVETMQACDGIGLAAPQVHHSIRLFIIMTPIEVEPDKLEYGEIEVFINPVLSSPSKKTWIAQEGCLSIPTLRSPIERPRSITVAYTNLDGAKITREVSGWEARVIMHENDHINGVLFIDRLSQEDKQKLAPYLQDLEKKLHDGIAF